MQEVLVLKKVVIVVVFVAAVVAWPISTSSAQIGQRSEPQTQQERDFELRRQQEANKKRQDDIRSDTQKLYQLAGELKDAVDKTNEHVLSLDVVKKAEEVEKLAKKVKEKMREGVGKPITVEPPLTPSRPPFGPS